MTRERSSIAHLTPLARKPTVWSPSFQHNSHDFIIKSDAKQDSPLRSVADVGNYLDVITGRGV